MSEGIQNRIYLVLWTWLNSFIVKPSFPQFLNFQQWRVMAINPILERKIFGKLFLPSACSLWAAYFAVAYHSPGLFCDLGQRGLAAAPVATDQHRPRTEPRQLDGCNTADAGAGAGDHAGLSVEGRGGVRHGGLFLVTPQFGSCLTWGWWRLRNCTTPWRVQSSFPLSRRRRCAMDFAWIWHTRDSVTPSTVPISFMLRSS